MTSPPVDDPETLRRILDQAEALFLDFDGPICDVFATLPASEVVAQLCVVLADGGYGEPPPEIEKSSDPFDVLKYAADLGETEARYVNASLTAHEIEAVFTATPTAGAHELIGAWARTGRPIAIVSNNSKLAVETYVDRHSLRSFATWISAREMADPGLLKPSPHLLNAALVELSVTAEAVVFVGDSLTDIDAARAAGTMSIAYANKAAKLKPLLIANPTLTVSTMSSIGRALNV